MSIDSSAISKLVVGGSGASRLMYAADLARAHDASNADTITVQPSNDTNTIGIGQIRNLTKRLSLAPFNSHGQVALLTELHLATIEAQNALLKIIEEPPANTCIIVTAQTAAGVLPTIVSRCNIIELTSILPVLSDEQTEQYKKELNELFAGGINIRLVKAERMSNGKNTAITWLQEMTLVIRSLLISAVKGKKSEQPVYSTTTLTTLARKITAATHTLETTNTNVRLLIENLLLEFPKFT